MGLLCLIPRYNPQNNAIYNLLPDIISRLSDPERGMSADDFNVIMKYVPPPITTRVDTVGLFHGISL